MSCLKCSLAMIKCQDTIWERLAKERLPPADYEISDDYGSVVLTKSNISKSLGMIGAPVNMYSKINLSHSNVWFFIS